MENAVKRPAFRPDHLHQPMTLLAALDGLTADHSVPDVINQIDTAVLLKAYHIRGGSIYRVVKNHDFTATDPHVNLANGRVMYRTKDTVDIEHMIQSVELNVRSKVLNRSLILKQSKTSYFCQAHITRC